MILAAEVPAPERAPGDDHAVLPAHPDLAADRRFRRPVPAQRLGLGEGGRRPGSDLAMTGRARTALS